jgi:hypothetical protein
MKSRETRLLLAPLPPLNAAASASGAPSLICLPHHSSRRQAAAVVAPECVHWRVLPVPGLSAQCHRLTISLIINKTRLTPARSSTSGRTIIWNHFTSMPPCFSHDPSRRYPRPGLLAAAVAVVGMETCPQVAPAAVAPALDRERRSWSLAQIYNANERRR